jgi:hypothetical protein
LQARGERCRSDLKTFQSLAQNLAIEPSEPDAFRKKHEVNVLIQVRFFFFIKIVYI